MRHIINLNGQWRFLADLDPEYHRQNSDYAAPEWDRRHWELRPVPACWNKYAERYELFEGVCWFARAFDLPEWSEEMIGVLRFGAVNYAAEVFVNGQHAGSHVGGYTEFTLDVSHLLKRGENVIAVKVDNRRQRILLPDCLGWFNYGGIHRDVELEITRRARIEWVGVEAAPQGCGAAGRLRVEVRQRSDDVLWLQATIRDPQEQVIWQATFAPNEGQAEVGFAIAEAAPWSLAHPALYRLELALQIAGQSVDALSARFGIRHIRAEGDRLLLNGEPLWLKGICNIGDHPAVGICYDEGIERRDLDELQSLGVNAMRFHFPPPRQFLDECDRRGMLICTEVPIYCLTAGEGKTSTFANPAFIALGQQMLGEMVRAHYNHPSIILWSIGNECQVSHADAPGFFRQMAAAVRALDRSRLLTYASLYGEMGEVGEIVDVIGVNEYWGWYDRVGRTPDRDRPLPTEVITTPDGSRQISVGALDLSRLSKELDDKARRYHKPILFTEFGADALPGYRSAERALWSEDYQAHFLERSLALMMESPGVCGAFPFLYQDYPDPSKYTNSYWNGLNLKGIVSYDRTPKLAFETLREMYTK